MGSWKSTVGKKLAQKIKMEFIDTDDAIEELMEMKGYEDKLWKKLAKENHRTILRKLSYNDYLKE